MSYIAKFRFLVLVSGGFFIAAALFLAISYKGERAKAEVGPFKYFGATPAGINEVNTRIKAVAASDPRGLTLQRFLQVAGFVCSVLFAKRSLQVNRNSGTAVHFQVWTQWWDAPITTKSSVYGVLGLVWIRTIAYTASLEYLTAAE